MKRRDFLRTSAVLAIAMAGAESAAEPATRWIVRSSEGYDALSFLGPLSGDPFYLEYYEDAVAEFAPRLAAGTIDRIAAIKERMAESGLLLSPFLDLVFSSGRDRDIATLLAALDRREELLRPPFEASAYWNEDGWASFDAAADQLSVILAAMVDADFAAFWRARTEAKLAARTARLVPRLADFDVIPELARFTGRRFDPAIEVVLLEFCKPHGVKVQGQQFLTAIDWGDDIVIRTAGHELLHPPVDLNGTAFSAALAVLERDTLLARIVAEHNPAFGYNSLPGLLDEDLASAVDQIIGERLGVARDPAERWNSVDDGMHVLAAGLYGLMRHSGFAETGGSLERWLHRIALYGWLAPPMLHGTASQILGRSADRLWPLPA